MGRLGRRLDAPEAIAAEARRCALHDLIAPLAARRGVSAAAVLDHFECLQGEAAWQRGLGLSDDEILARMAAQWGMIPEELCRWAGALVGRLP